MLFYLINLAYFLMMCGLLTHDILYLRGLLVLAQSMIAFYAWRSGVPVIAYWNVLIGVMNTFMAAQVIRERRAVVLPPALQRLYERHFTALTPPEFLRWWNRGQQERLQHCQLTTNGEYPDWLYFVLAGTVTVSRGDETVVELPAGYFVAEMSLLTGEPANADVHAHGVIDVIRWPSRELKGLQHENPLLWSKLQSVIGHDLVDKLRRTERALHVDDRGQDQQLPRA